MISAKRAREIAASYGVRSLLSVNADAKTSKGVKADGVLTGIFYGAPHKSAGVGNLCAFASPGCIAACLNTAGRASIFPAIIAARIARTRFMVKESDAFRAMMRAEIDSLARRAARLGLRAAVRLDGTTDFGLARLFAADFPSVIFYDYTKNARRMSEFLDGAYPSNYSLTFSRSETNEADSIAILARGGNVAIPFHRFLPEAWNGFRVVNGDASDFRPNDPRGVVVGLKAKGRARRDDSGFVVKA